MSKPVWLPYPKFKPQDTLEAKAQDYVVLVPNPRPINKHGVNDHTPKYFAFLATWLGDCFFDENIRPLDARFYITLPPHA